MALLPYYRTTLLPYYLTTSLPHYLPTSLPHYLTTTLTTWGSMAFGALVIALCQLVRVMLKHLDRQVVSTLCELWVGSSTDSFPCPAVPLEPAFWG